MVNLREARDMSSVGVVGADASVIIDVLSRVLTQLIDLNKNVTSKQQLITKFQSSYPPSISILSYLERISKYAKCSPNCFIIALVYIDRLIETRNVILSTLNVHRLLITSIMLATKVYDDEFYKNSYYAKLGGVSTQEMNSLELEFLGLMNFDFFVSVETFEKYQKELAAFMNRPSSADTPYTPIPKFGSNGTGPTVTDDGVAGVIQPNYQSNDVSGRQQAFGAIGQQSSLQQQHDGVDIEMAGKGVPLSYDGGYASASNYQGIMRTPPRGVMQSGPPHLTPSLSKQSYFVYNHHQMQQQGCQSGQYQQPLPQQQVSFDGRGYPYSRQHCGGHNYFSYPHPIGFPSSRGCGNGQYVAPVTTPTSVTETVFQWGNNDGSCGMPQKQQMMQPPNPPSSYYHPAVNMQAGQRMFAAEQQQGYSQVSAPAFNGAPSHPPQMHTGGLNVPYYHPHFQQGNEMGFGPSRMHPREVIACGGSCGGQRSYWSSLGNQ